MKFLKNHALSFLVCFVMIGVTVYLYPNLPNEIPTRFNLEGKPIAYATKEVQSFFMPVLYLFVIFLVGIFVSNSAKANTMKNSQEVLAKVILAVGFVLLGVHIGSLLSFKGEQYFLRFFSLGAALFLVYGGSVFGKLEKNYFIGIRVPWTLSSDENWRRTHRLAGVLMVLFGILLFAFSFFVQNMMMAVAAILIPCLLPIIYSFYYFKKFEN
ncbi:SdpI family protein [Bacteriovorax sp. DB6_IX]|uniref:SdpI family protein n=2 Tax=Bacteriovorax sp. DB6_IX TaxID=1353530 RepID=UPI00038A1BC0|nr:SdpI family protein [Bacteriovorax sp. DB6_IX]EQC51129.1 PF07853 family protein [Bacteriovorax sp. DB6_IX]